MPIALNSTVTTSTFGTAVQFTLTAAAGDVLLCFVGQASGTRSVSAMAYNSIAMSRIMQVDNNRPLELWALTAPNAGTLTLSAQFSGTGNNWLIHARTYSGVKASGGFGTAISATAAAVLAQISVSSSATGLVVGAHLIGGDNIISCNGTNQDSASVAGGVQMRTWDIAGAAAVTVSCSCSGAAQNWSMLALPLVFSVAAVTSPRTLCLTGVGR